MNRRQLIRTAAVGLPAAVLGGVVSQVSSAQAGSSTNVAETGACEPVPCTPGTGQIIQWGYRDLQPVPASGLTGVTKVAAGVDYGLMIKNGRVSIWGIEASPRIPFGNGCRGCPSPRRGTSRRSRVARTPPMRSEMVA